MCVNNKRKIFYPVNPRKTSNSIENTSKTYTTQVRHKLKLTVRHKLKFTVHHIIPDLHNSTNISNFPQNWTLDQKSLNKISSNHSFKTFKAWADKTEEIRFHWRFSSQRRSFELLTSWHLGKKIQKTVLILNFYYLYCEPYKWLKI